MPYWPPISAPWQPLAVMPTDTTPGNASPPRLSAAPSPRPENDHVAPVVHCSGASSDVDVDTVAVPLTSMAPTTALVMLGDASAWIADAGVIARTATAAATAPAHRARARLGPAALMTPG